jgi:asparagine synthetase B (glutamine-hydrolysing)
MKKPFVAGIIHSKDLKSLDRWEISNGKSYLRAKKNNSYVMIKKRDSYPKTFIKESNGSLFIGYGEPSVNKLLTKKYLSNFSKKKQNFFKQLKDNRKEFFISSLSANKVFIDRDEFCAIPIFYFRDKDLFIFSNKFSFVLTNVSRDKININFQGLAEYLLLLESANRTPIDKINILTERSNLELDDRNFSIGLPPNKAVIKERISRKNEMKLFTKRLRSVFLAYDKKIPQETKIGIELSGGLDSSTVAHFFSKKRKDAKLYSMDLPKKVGKAQKNKLKDLIEFIGLEHKSVKIKDKYPLSRYAKTKKLFPLYPQKEIYTEALEYMLTKARRDGVEVIFTGMGGDELFLLDKRENIGFKGKEEAEFRRRVKMPIFFTSKFKKDFFKRVFFDNNIPIPPVPYSVLGAHVSRNNIFIEHGIWPIAPLGDSELARFCRSLPNQMCRNKYILREYQKKNTFPKGLYESFTNEYFGNFFDESLKGPLYDFIISLYKKSVLDNLGLIDKKILIKDYQKFVRTNKHENPLLFYEVAVMEIVLQSLS